MSADISPLSAAAKFKLGIQSDFDTVATDYLCGRMSQSRANERFNTVEPSVEHFCGDNDRATQDKSAPYHTSYWMDLQAQWAFYPDLIGVALLLAGWKLSGTVDNTGTNAGYTHTFVLADRDEHKWGSAISKLGSGSIGIERKISKVRLNRLALTASKRNGCTWEATGMGLGVAEATGSETTVQETAVKFLPSKGSMSIQADAADIFTYATDHTFAIDNGLRQDEDFLFSTAIADLPQQAIRVSGQFQNVPFEKDLLRKIVYDAADLTGAPKLTVKQASVAFTHQTEQYVDPSGTQPYTFTFSATNCALTLGQYQASGDELVRVPVDWRMLDLTTTPATITLINNVPDYVDFAA